MSDRPDPRPAPSSGAGLRVSFGEDGLPGKRTAADAAVVRLEGVHRRYRTTAGWVEALRGVDLSVPRGVIQGVIGSSGAGKSTLVRCIGGLERPDEGRVLLGGVDLATRSGAALRAEQRRIGMVFQQFNLLRSRTAAENVALPLRIAGRSRSETEQRVKELLEWVGLAERGGSYPAQLSGGQRQRVAIARALANRPDLLLGDEPTSALDPSTTTSVLDLLRRVRDELGVTILLITHQMQVVRALCDRVAVIEEGRIVEEGPVAEVVTHPRSAAAQRFLRPRVRPGGPDASAWTPPAGERVVRVELHFSGPQAEEPIVSDIIRAYAVTVNFLAGEIDRMERGSFAWLRVEIAGGEDALAAALAALRERGVRVLDRFDEAAEAEDVDREPGAGA